MNYASCLRLFTLFTGLTADSPFLVFLDAAISEVRSECKDGIAPDDDRLSYYCAALGNLRYTQFLAAKSGISHTYAGNLAKQHDDSVPCGLAEHLVAEFRAAAADLLTDRRFVFTGIR